MATAEERILNTADKSGKLLKRFVNNFPLFMTLQMTMSQRQVICHGSQVMEVIQGGGGVIKAFGVKI